MSGYLQTLLFHEDGQALTEYSLILAFIALAVIIAVSQLAEPIVNLLEKVSGSFTVD